MSDDWNIWIKAGKHKKGEKRNALNKCGSDSGGGIRGYYSDFKLNPALDCTNSLYPSIDHNGSSPAVVDARLINDMKSILSEDEFWKVIGHLCAVGMEKGKILKRDVTRLQDVWKPERNF
jgi:hypothetical protein